MLESLKEEVFQANLELKRQNVVIYTWGNVSGITEDRKYIIQTFSEPLRCCAYALYLRCQFCTGGEGN